MKNWSVILFSLAVAGPALASETTDSYFKVQKIQNLGIHGWGYLGAAIRVSKGECGVTVEDFAPYIPKAVREDVLGFMEAVNVFEYEHNPNRTCQFIKKQFAVIKKG